MTRILTLFYLILFLGVGLTSAYVVYHILRYSLSKRQAVLTVGLFGSVLLFLLATNALFFFRIDWDGMLSNPSALHRAYGAHSSSGY